MNPIKLSYQLKDTLVNYLTTTFDVNRSGHEKALAEFIRQSFNQPRALFAGPYLELTAPYETGPSLQELVKEGVISPKLLQMQCFQEGRPLPIDAPLYTHQVASLRKLCAAQENVVVSSGTGSGKTECFLIPILNDLLLDPSPGVRAVLVYPLNALVNDQLDRLRLLLRNTDITFGRYTSELVPQADTARRQMEKEWMDMEPTRKALFDQYPLPNEIIGRDQIQKDGRLPQILITNYAMLEYLLLRPEDSPLFAKGKWRFVVLDEAHTYAGAQGIEVGLLMRRLKHRLGHEPGRMRCIATSATLTDDDADDAKQFAEALFGEKFEQSDIIFGQPDHNYIPPSAPRWLSAETYLHPRFDDLLANVRQEKWGSADEMALLMQEIGLITAEELALADRFTNPPRLLWEVLRGNEDVTHLRRFMLEKGQPVEVTAVAEELFHSRLPPEKQQDALYHLIELAAMARPNVDEASLLPARYHLFVRPPQGIWACLNPTCPDKPAEESWSKLFASPRETCSTCQSPVYPLVVCRTCGQVYVRLQKVGKQYLPEAPLQDEPHQHYVTWRPIAENRALADGEEQEEDDEEALVEQAGESVLQQTEMVLCIQCLQEVKANGRCDCQKPSDRTIAVHLLQKARTVKKGSQQGTTNDVIHHMNECGRCHSRALKGTEIVTDITLNALTPLAILAEDLYRELPESPKEEVRNKAGSGRKLLSFYDSRQGAARFAAFVQDIVNQQAYRRLIYETVRTASNGRFYPDLEKVSQDGLALALQYRVAHNDPILSKSDLPRDSQYLSQSQRERLIHHMRKHVFAEVTTQLRSRQSLEALGLITVHYFEPEKQPNLDDLALKLSLSPAETQALIGYLLDELRRAKVVVLPDGVKRDDSIFGRNKFSPRLVSHEANEYELAWIGKTERHRRRQLMRKILRHKGLPHDETAVIDALTHILNWLVYEGDILDTSRPDAGYQVRHDRLFFHTATQWYRCDQCQRLHCRSNALLCPHAYCEGTLQPIAETDLTGKNFYYDNLQQTLVPMRVEEHTAQLDPAKGRLYQTKFKNGEINMLSCSTTFEMGIDLGDLQAVIMSNIPPTVANYKQRAGRAGRRTSGTAFILAWASNRPHDQAYFKTPAEIIGGLVRVPYLDIDNLIIIRRHVNAILLSEFLRYCAGKREFEKTVGAFFDEQAVGGPYYSLLSSWLNDQQAHLSALLDRFAMAVDEKIDIKKAVVYFEQDLRLKGNEYYQSVADYYKATREKLAQEQLKLVLQGTSQREINSLADELNRFGKLLERLQRENIINFLSDRGILPSYSFPLHTVELRIPPQLLPDKELRLQRNVQEAIREYAPGQEVVADKRIWISEGLEFFGKEPQIYAYHICPTCNHLQIEQTAGKELEGANDPCPICHSLPRRGRDRQKQYIEPDGFRASGNSGQPAGQYVDRPFNLMRSALVPGPVDTIPIGEIISTGYDRAGRLLYVNEGFQGGGFRICLVCGKSLSMKARKCDGWVNGQPCPGKPKRTESYMLGFTHETDMLHLRFSSTPYAPLPEPDNLSFWLSLKFALLQGASRALQIERRDIEGVLFPEGIGQQWRQTVVLYDNVPGGAGHVKRIQDEIGQVIAAALEIVDCDCEKSCYRCLREYANQWQHHLLARESVEEYLRVLDADLQRSEGSAVVGLYPVAAVNQAAWLWDKIQQAQHELILSADMVDLHSPTSTGTTWLEGLQTLLQRRVSVRLFLNQLPNPGTKGDGAVGLAIHLRLLLRKGLDLRLTNRSVPWTAIIDAQTASSAAIKTSDDTAISLSDDLSTKLLITQHSETVNAAREEMETYRGRSVEHADLLPPPNTHVQEIVSDGQKHDERDYFTDFYAQPVRGIVINDRYLMRRETILQRLGTHIELAHQHGQLEWVLIQTRSGSEEQKKAFQELKTTFPDVRIKVKLGRDTEHDRFIELTRADDSKARAIIGLGLGFIEPNGNLRQTFLIIQDPFEERL